jgi:hypothetical protein
MTKELVKAADLESPIPKGSKDWEAHRLDAEEDAELNRIADERSNSRELPVSFDEL